MDFPEKLLAKLEERKHNHSLRSLQLPQKKSIDFSSNDYLGIVKNGLLAGQNKKAFPSGSTGSRLLTGHSELIDEAEKNIADFHEAESALIYNSGYDTNVGILSSLPQKGDTIFYDSLCHASIRDGIRLSYAKAFSFRHNDTADLQKKLQHSEGTIYIVTESVFSMDGDISPLQELLVICDAYKAYLILDEAHAIGVIGEKGEGLAQSLQVHDTVFCRVYTFGKACGCHGAVAVGSKQLRDYLINFSRSFIYTTSLPPHSVRSILETYQTFPTLQKEREKLRYLIEDFQKEEWLCPVQKSTTPIQAIFVQGNNRVKELACKLQSDGIDVRAILSPTVPMGSERLRIILHSFNKREEIEHLRKACNELF